MSLPYSSSSSSSDMSSPTYARLPHAHSTDASQSDDPPPRVYDVYSYSKLSPNTRVFYIQHQAAADVAIASLNSKVLGFDLEWRPNFVKGNPENPVALVQLASEDTILLIHLAQMPGHFPEKLKELLLDPTIVKAGVGIQKDCRKLYMDHGVDTRNCVDLSLLARTVDNQRWKGKYSNPIGLSRLCETYEERTLQKGKVQISNWERALDFRQQEYAANDCHAGLVLYKRFAKLAEKMSPVPHRVWYSFDTISGHLYQPSSGTVWHPYNPYYDPGPPPPPRPPRPENEQGTPNDVFPKPYRNPRYGRQNRTRPIPLRPLSPTAPDFVPGAKEHSPSPSPSPVPSFGNSHARSQPPFPRASDVRVNVNVGVGAGSVNGGFSADADGFPRLPRASRVWQQPASRPKSFRGAAPGSGVVHAHPHNQRGGRAHGRDGYAVVVAPTG